MDAMARRTCVLAFSACLLAPFSAEQNAVAEPAPCRAVTYETNSYTVCEVDLRRETIRLFWKRPECAPYGYLNALPSSLGERSSQLIIATNAGMFDTNTSPLVFRFRLRRSRVCSGIGRSATMRCSWMAAMCRAYMFPTSNGDNLLPLGLMIGEFEKPRPADSN